MARALISKSSDRVRKKRTRSRSRDAKCAGEWGLSLVRHPRERCEPWPALCLVSSYIFADRTRERSKSSRGRTSPSCDCAWRGTGNISIKARARSSAELEAPLSPLPAHCCCRCRRRTHHEAEQLALARIEAPNDESAAVGRDLHLHEEEQWLVEVEWLIEMHTVVQACHHLDAAAQTQRFGYCPEQIDARGKRWGKPMCISALYFIFSFGYLRQCPSACSLACVRQRCLLLAVAAFDRPLASDPVRLLVSKPGRTIRIIHVRQSVASCGKSGQCVSQSASFRFAYPPTPTGSPRRFPLCP